MLHRRHPCTISPSQEWEASKRGPIIDLSEQVSTLHMMPEARVPSGGCAKQCSVLSGILALLLKCLGLVTPRVRDLCLPLAVSFGGQQALVGERNKFKVI